ncbi:MAG: glycosyltransferase family 2 protein [Microcystis wesenbergii Mw_MB_S_20031200_S109]|uniref:Glycosyltransferase family 2 protein n=1 Tax=Microcystis wesenbergii Mw_MB_S_20031200_S109D TaxID=2486241 RepID=A0A552LKD0_9CHRO|nr:MAG: glycosyltransferase family 2 protein [Microcystis wesenbergii Mw_MB_S_20031200_S109]TRV20676.1 MAG: glycosyltransferase family 2 protein [Microcystis wesenbergii Mw_MB_S_20031200_S109D]
MADFQLTTPVAFLIFNRPDTTARVFEAIRQAKPPKLLVVADGPRADRPDDVEKCKAARAIIDGVDWDCEVLTNYSEVNLGCKNRVSSGLNWVFDTVEEAIILEDDCLPHTTFFRFCEELLDYYRNDERIMSIVGCNFQFGRRRTNYSYYFSRINLIWGWATWKRAWHYYDIDMSLWTEVKRDDILKYILHDPQETRYWTKIFQRTYDEDINSWGYRWILSCFLQHGLAITPNINLVSNIGFSVNATHTTNDSSLINSVKVEAMSFPLRHTPYIIPHISADKFTYHVYCQTPLTRRVVKKLKTIFEL